MSRLNRKAPRIDALMRYANMLGFGDIHTKIDHQNDLRCIIAVHNTRLGPAIGGCRFYPYTSFSYAYKDVLRLAYMMTLKSAISELPHGGAKAVIMYPRHAFDRKKLMYAFGDFLNKIQGQYITSMDVGTTASDMDLIYERSPYVIGSTKTLHDDPSRYTGLGIFRGLQAAAKFKLQRDSLEGLHVVLQGAGKVSYYVCQHLHAAKAKITICDVNAESVARCQEEFNATIVSPEAIYDVPCDIFSPSAIGGTINKHTIDRLQTSIIAGAANNQLAHSRFIQLLEQKNILFVPDYVINAGGVIYAALAYDNQPESVILKQVDAIEPRLLNIFQEAKARHLHTTDVANQMAKQRLQEA
ncbi:MAG: Glu/Leu/Phe/Val dehydrogenase [Gammaproteobacteria bacterium]|nr:Glu/Leu/Phe/Val dehydrogenase [Gammaproteobacteria bacterium]MCD8524263.1 Glu/Leu/Phe/Val dehydrogenase [Gammaproteobacteria bacterium]MCD8543256.1 Glu/Leu/Phe/Val dehydrogenase [Gammaproteobacteria bacterium]